MRVLLAILIGSICVWYFVNDRRVQTNIRDAIDTGRAVVGMSRHDVQKALGEPLMVRTEERFFGDETKMTFVNGNEVTFHGEKAVKVDTATMSEEFNEARRAVVNRRQNPAPSTAFKAQMGGTALDRGPYRVINGRVVYTRSDDPNKLGTATESDAIPNRRKGR